MRKDRNKGGVRVDIVFAGGPGQRAGWPKGHKKPLWGRGITGQTQPVLQLPVRFAHPRSGTPAGVRTYGGES